MMAIPIKCPEHFPNRTRESPLLGDSLPKSGNFWHFGGHIPPPSGDWGEILHSQADPCDRRCCQVCRESMQRVTPAGEKADFWHVSKFNKKKQKQSKAKMCNGRRHLPLCSTCASEKHIVQKCNYNTRLSSVFIWLLFTTPVNSTL